jgi:uncharacterized protein
VTRASYLVMGTPRCATGLLRSLLTSTGVAGRPEEYFWRDTMAELLSRWGVDEDGYLARVRSEGTTPNGVFAANLMWTYLGDAEETLRRQSGATGCGHALFASVFREPRWIWRDDAVAQGAWARAELSGEWFAGQAPGGAATPAFDFTLVHNLIWVATPLQFVARRWFAGNGLATAPRPVRGPGRGHGRRHADAAPTSRTRAARGMARRAGHPATDRRPERRLDRPLPSGARRLPPELPPLTDPLPRELDWRGHMTLEMRGTCERCDGLVTADGRAYIYSYECTFCATCADTSRFECPNCGGELVPRPRRLT